MTKQPAIEQDQTHEEATGHPGRGNPQPHIERNEVALVGRVSDVPEERVLPSGDAVWTFRLVVPRPEGARRGSRATVDVVPCAVWGGRVRASVRTWRAGDVVEVEGALRRRFFKSAGSAASVMEIDVATGRMVRRAATA